jgi:indole-3-glycerol phosphate synthase
MEQRNKAKIDDEKDIESSRVIMNYQSRLSNQNERAPRLENGELILRRREVHSGRALTVSSVEWSVAEKSAKPTSVIEGYMWDKETEVDRFRERTPLSNLMSQCKLQSLDPSSLRRPRDWIGSIKLAMQDGARFVTIPEIKRIEPSFGTLRKRYNVAKIAKQLTLRGMPAMCVNCDAIMYGGSITDISEARDASSKAIFEMEGVEDGVIVPPILASDLILYPYQLYKLYLAGADAVKLLVGALSGKDLLYLCKIASSLQMQPIVAVTSEVQIRQVLNLDRGSVSAMILSNLNLEDFTYDNTGNQALGLLESEALKELKVKLGPELPVFVDFRLLPEMTGDFSVEAYTEKLMALGATGSIVNALSSNDE